MDVETNLAKLVIDAFGGLTATARALDHKHVTTVQGWLKSGTIPRWRRLEIIAAADRAGVSLPGEFVASGRGKRSAA